MLLFCRDHHFIHLSIDTQIVTRVLSFACEYFVNSRTMFFSCEVNLNKGKIRRENNLVRNPSQDIGR